MAKDKETDNSVGNKKQKPSPRQDSDAAFGTPEPQSKARLFLGDAMEAGGAKEAADRMTDSGNLQTQVEGKFPRDINGYDGDTRRALETLGFTLGDDIDQHFMQATLPAGWALGESYGHWTPLQDDRGRKRAEIFIGDFQDMDAFINLEMRLRLDIETNRQPTEKEEDHIFCLKDAGKTAQQICILTMPCLDLALEQEAGGDTSLKEEWLRGTKMRDDIQDIIEATLAKHLPRYKDPLAYWDAGINEKLESFVREAQNELAIYMEQLAVAHPGVRQNSPRQIPSLRL